MYGYNCTRAIDALMLVPIRMLCDEAPLVFYPITRLSIRPQKVQFWAILGVRVKSRWNFARWAVIPVQIRQIIVDAPTMLWFF